MNKLNQGDNQYCGPAALSIITGASTDKCASVIGEIVGKDATKVKAIYVADFIKAARKMRVKIVSKGKPNCSLFATIHDVINFPGLYLVGLEKHFVVIEITRDRQVFFCDNHTKEPIKAVSSSRLSQKVVDLLECTPMGAPILIGDKITVYLDNFNTYHVSLVSEFRDPSDNCNYPRGSIRVTKPQLAEVIEELKKFL